MLQIGNWRGYRERQYNPLVSESQLLLAQARADLCRRHPVKASLATNEADARGARYQPQHGAPVRKT